MELEENFGDKLRKAAEQALPDKRAKTIRLIMNECEKVANDAKHEYIVPGYYIRECQFSNLEMMRYILSHMKGVKADINTVGFVVITW